MIFSGIYNLHPCLPFNLILYLSSLNSLRLSHTKLATVLQICYVLSQCHIFEHTVFNTKKAFPSAFFVASISLLKI